LTNHYFVEKNMFKEQQRPGQFYEKDISGCAVAAIMNTAGIPFGGQAIIDSIETQHERSNGLGGGFAAYGIYPNLADFYAFHVMYEDEQAAKETEKYIYQDFILEKKEIIPHRHDTVIRKHPLLRRYFVQPRPVEEKTPDRSFEHLSDDELVFKAVMHINKSITGAYVFSSGKNMGVFKGVGYPEDIGRFFKLEEYEAYTWISHGRFPTNSAGWWGGAHPFSLLNWAVVHNGEISSYGKNKRYLENFGYECTLFTDTEVIAYIFDLLVRRHGLSLEMAARVIAAPFWDEIDRMIPEDKELYTLLRATYGGALLNGPFGVVVGFEGGMIGINDRIKLRPLVAATKGDFVYMASEESAIREIAPELDEVWSPRGGEPVIATLKSNPRAYAYAGMESK
jgi:glutamate synthase domain-containing protein 1